MKKTGILWFIVTVIGLETQKIASALQGLLFICWEYSSVGSQRARKVSEFRLYPNNLLESNSQSKLDFLSQLHTLDMTEDGIDRSWECTKMFKYC